MKTDTRRVIVFITVGMLFALGVGVAVWRLADPASSRSDTATTPTTKKNYFRASDNGQDSNNHSAIDPDGDSYQPKAGREVTPQSNDPFLAPNAVFNTEKLRAKPTTIYRPDNISAGGATADSAAPSNNTAPTILADGAVAAPTPLPAPPRSPHDNSPAPHHAATPPAQPTEQPEDWSTVEPTRQAWDTDDTTAAAATTPKSTSQPPSTNPPAPVTTDHSTDLTPDVTLKPTVSAPAPSGDPTTPQDANDDPTPRDQGTASADGSMPSNASVATTPQGAPQEPTP